MSFLDDSDDDASISDSSDSDDSGDDDDEWFLSMKRGRQSSRTTASDGSTVATVDEIDAAWDAVASDPSAEPAPARRVDSFDASVPTPSAPKTFHPHRHPRRQVRNQVSLGEPCLPPHPLARELDRFPL